MKGKKLLVTLSVIALSSASALSLVACGDKHTHSVSDWETVLAATCETEGSKKGTCSECKKEVTDTIPAIGHAYGEWLVTEEPIGEDGAAKRHCANDSAHDQTVAIPVGTERVSAKNATIYEGGRDKYSFTDATHGKIDAFISTDKLPVDVETIFDEIEKNEQKLGIVKGGYLRDGATEVDPIVYERSKNYLHVDNKKDNNIEYFIDLNDAGEIVGGVKDSSGKFTFLSEYDWKKNVLNEDGTYDLVVDEDSPIMQYLNGGATYAIAEATISENFAGRGAYAFLTNLWREGGKAPTSGDKLKKDLETGDLKSYNNDLKETVVTHEDKTIDVAISYSFSKYSLAAGGALSAILTQVEIEFSVNEDMWITDFTVETNVYKDEYIAEVTVVTPENGAPYNKIVTDEEGVQKITLKGDTAKLQWKNEDINTGVLELAGTPEADKTVSLSIEQSALDVNAAEQLQNPFKDAEYLDSLSITEAKLTYNGVEVNENDTLSVTTAQGLTLRLNNIVPLKNLNYFDIFENGIYLKEEGKEEVAFGKDKNFYGGFVIMEDEISITIRIREKSFENATVIIRLGDFEKSFKLTTELANPATAKVTGYVYNEASNAFDANSAFDDVSLYVGQEFKFVATMIGQEADYLVKQESTASVTSANAATATITAGQVEDAAGYIFKATAPGKYTVRVASKAVSSVKYEFTVNVKEVPASADLLAGSLSDKKENGYSVTFAENQVTVTEAGADQHQVVYAYTVNDQNRISLTRQGNVAPGNVKPGTEYALEFDFNYNVVLVYEDQFDMTQRVILRGEAELPDTAAVLGGTEWTAKANSMVGEVDCTLTFNEDGTTGFMLVEGANVGSMKCQFSYELEAIDATKFALVFTEEPALEGETNNKVFFDPAAASGSYFDYDGSNATKVYVQLKFGIGLLGLNDPAGSEVGGGTTLTVGETTIKIAADDAYMGVAYTFTAPAAGNYKLTVKGNDPLAIIFDTEYMTEYINPDFGITEYVFSMKEGDTETFICGSNDSMNDTTYTVVIEKTEGGSEVDDDQLVLDVQKEIEIESNGNVTVYLTVETAGTYEFAVEFDVFNGQAEFVFYLDGAWDADFILSVSNPSAEIKLEAGTHEVFIAQESSLNMIAPLTVSLKA